MAFKPTKKPVQFAHLKQTLSNANPDNPLYQTIQAIIEKLTQFQNQDTKEKDEIRSSIGGASSSGDVAIDNLSNLTYLTDNNESGNLPNSRQLLAGIGIEFDDSVANERTINSVATYYDAPLTDGDLIATDLIFAAGECIIVQIPV